MERLEFELRLGCNIYSLCSFGKSELLDSLPWPLAVPSTGVRKPGNTSVSPTAMI